MLDPVRLSPCFVRCGEEGPESDDGQWLSPCARGERLASSLQEPRAQRNTLRRRLLLKGAFVPFIDGERDPLPQVLAPAQFWSGARRAVKAWGKRRLSRAGR